MADKFARTGLKTWEFRVPELNLKVRYQLAANTTLGAWKQLVKTAHKYHGDEGRRRQAFARQVVEGAVNLWFKCEFDNATYWVEAENLGGQTFSGSYWWDEDTKDATHEPKQPWYNKGRTLFYDYEHQYGK